ncbi:hypothetical protein AC1031_001669 [Aphanomyces cochlioides]|nr:hypothetical protein AC1031_001669 [Aphanomyces cochlioides]
MRRSVHATAFLQHGNRHASGPVVPLKFRLKDGSIKLIAMTLTWKAPVNRRLHARLKYAQSQHKKQESNDVHGSQSKGQVKHVFFLLTGFRELVKEIFLKNHMTREHW